MSSKHQYSSSGREKVFEFISSATEIEFALAEAIKAQTRILRKENLNADQIENATDALTELIALSIQKEMMLEFLIKDIMDAWETINNPDPKK